MVPVQQATATEKMSTPAVATTTETENRGKHFRPDIEGLRGLAILMVVAYHISARLGRGGYIGVDVFFVLSGYLITGLILREIEETGRLSFREFYARRVRRLLPAAAVVLLATLLIGVAIFGPDEMSKLSESAKAAALYTSNFLFINRSTDYLSPSGKRDILLNTWSLGVEEQFYLLWPLLLVALAALGKRTIGAQRVVALGMALLIGASFALCVWLTNTLQPWAFFSTPTRFWEFGLGGLGAMVPLAFARRLNRNGALPAVGLAMILFAAMLFNKDADFPGYLAALPAIGTVLVLITGAARSSGVFRLLSLAPLQWFGRYSYSWYLWHFPLILFIPTFTLVSPVLLVAAIALLALALAVVTTKLIEQPVRYSSALRRRPLISIGAGLALSMAVVGAALCVQLYAEDVARRPEQQEITRARTDFQPRVPADCQLDFFQIEPDLNCVYGDVTSAQTVLLFGDSHAAQWFPAMDYVAKAKHWRLMVWSKSACPSPVLPNLYSDNLHRTYTECTQWRENIFEQLATIKPIMAVMSNSAAYAASDGLHLATPSEWREGLSQTIARITAAGSAPILIADPPSAYFDVTSCLSRARSALLGNADCTFTPRGAWNAETRAVEEVVMASLGSEHYIDLGYLVCAAAPCAAERDGQIIYRDGNHLTATFNATLGPALLAKMNVVPLATAASR